MSEVAPATQEKPKGPALDPRKQGPAPDPHKQAVSYLLHWGWRPLGIADHPTCLWLDPTKPLVATTRKEPIMVTDRRGKVSQAMVQNGEGKEKKVPGERLVITPDYQAQQKAAEKQLAAV